MSESGERSLELCFFLTLTLPLALNMFDFEKLDIYKKAKHFNASVQELLRAKNVSTITTNQISRAAFSIVLNIAEGSGRFSKRDRKNFFIIARSSVFECVAILDIMKDDKILSETEFRRLYDHAETLSKILYTMIRNLENK